MEWKKLLLGLEEAKRWDEAIIFMQEVIRKNPCDVEAYLLMEYLVMNLLVEEDYDRSKSGYYESLALKYFKEGYSKFSHNPGFLYYTGIIACMSEWYFGIEIEEAEEMRKKAYLLDPHNIVYQWKSVEDINISNITNVKKVTEYAKMVLHDHAFLWHELEKKGSLGQYVFQLMQFWADHIIRDDFNLQSL